MTIPEAHVLAVAFEERLADLLMYRRFYRGTFAMQHGAFLDPIKAEHRAELRALLRLRSKVRRATRAAEIMRTAAVDRGVETWMAR